ncbi:MAG: family 16 glycosylhydrolase [Bacteroidia bacterium]|nr:family 16 glycosylhydrolase [Bacteroidia bacterium]
MKYNGHWLLGILLILPPGIYGQAKRKTISLEHIQPTSIKQEYYLLMEENFDGPLDKKRWDKSGIGDENFDCTKNYRHVERNVFTKDGKLWIEVSKNSNEGCQYLGGEIKTFEYKEGSSFRNYWLFPGSYLEVKAKLPMGWGVASAGWLYSFDVNEVDMWEYWDEHKDRYQINYHWGKAYQKDSFKSDPFSVKLKDTHGAAVNLDEQFLVFGLEWDSTFIRHYLNGKLIKSYDLNQRAIFRSKQIYDPKTPAFLRFNCAPAMRCPEIYLPDSIKKYLELDYVRYYRKQGLDALPTLSVDDTLEWHAYGGGGSLSVAYHPDARYQWYAPDFHIADNSSPKCMCEKIWLSFDADLERGRSYPVILSVTFSSGYRELRSWRIYIN